MAIDAVKVAFRTGMLVSVVAHRLENSGPTDRSWSIIIPGVNSANTAAELCEQVRSNHFMLYCSNISLTYNKLRAVIRSYIALDQPALYKRIYSKWGNSKRPSSLSRPTPVHHVQES